MALKATTWEKKTLEQRAIAVGESKVTARSILGLIEEKYHGQLKSATSPAEFAERWSKLRAKVLNPKPESEPAVESVVESVEASE
jgi:hypothetical protein